MKLSQWGLILGIVSYIIVGHLIHLNGLSLDGHKVLGVAALMAIWWISEAVPIAVTALVPLALFPIIGINSISDVCKAMANQTIFLYMGGFILAVAIEKTMLHKRIALNIITRAGRSWHAVMWSFMVAAAFLSMWISNTATAVMLLPIGTAVVSQLKTSDTHRQRMGVSLMLALAYACSIGGIATLIGTPTNAVFASIVEKIYQQTISFYEWFLFGFPLAVVLLILSWLYLAKWVFRDFNLDIAQSHQMMQQELKALGRISSDEFKVALIFGSVAVLWIIKDLVLINIIPGVNDTSIAIIGVLLLFLMPSQSGDGHIIDWATAERIPWGILLLFGGGLAIADAFTTTGLAEWIGQQLNVINALPLVIVILIIVATVNFLTEITSNVATASMLMPVLAALAVTINVHPYILMVSATVAASCAFMLPVATPPNAVVFGSGYLKISDMIKAGLVLNIISIILIVLFIYFIMPLVWSLPSL